MLHTIILPTVPFRRNWLWIHGACILRCWTNFLQSRVWVRLFLQIIRGHHFRPRQPVLLRRLPHLPLASHRLRTGLRLLQLPLALVDGANLSSPDPRRRGRAAVIHSILLHPKADLHHPLPHRFPNLRARYDSAVSLHPLLQAKCGHPARRRKRRLVASVSP